MEYRSSFGNWDQRASVRVKPRRDLDSCPSGQIYFPPELVPAVDHPLVAALGPDVRHRLLVQRLYDYLHFTSELEALAVIPVATRISRGRAGLSLPESMRRDAFKIVTDEAWHAQFSYDLMKQVEDLSGVPRREPDAPMFTARLDVVRSALGPDLRGAEGLLFAVVSETLISAILADIPHDRRLPPVVRDLVRDHAEDEGRHHAYFRVVLKHFWHTLEPAHRREVGPQLPRIVLAFLEPDHRALHHALRDTGLHTERADQVLTESYPRAVLQQSAGAAASTTIRYFTEVGALDDSRTLDAFQAAGLVA